MIRLKSKRYVIFLIVAIMLICNILVICNSIVQAEQEVNFEDYTNDDNFYFNNSNYDICDYMGNLSNVYTITETPVDGLYGSTLKNSAKNKLLVNNDDPIVKIVPKELFKKPNIELIHVGEEYGFFIKTEVTVNNLILANVIVFDIENKINMYETKDHAQFKIQVLLQREYLYVSHIISESEGYIQKTRRINGHNIDGQIVYELTEKMGETFVFHANKSDIVMPLPYINGTEYLVLCDSQRFYVQDIASSIVLSNEQHLNQGDEGYDVYKDKGKFITQIDGAYKASVYNVNEKKYIEELSKSILCAAVMDGVEFVAKKAGYGAGVFLGDLLFKHYDAYISTLDTIETEINKFTYKPKHTTNQDQIENTGALCKYGFSKLQLLNEGQYGEGSFLFYGEGDYYESDFQMSYTSVFDEEQNCFETPWEARLTRGISLKFANNFSSDETIRYYDTFDFFLDRKDEKEHRTMEEEQQVVLLPGGNNLFKFVPERSGFYNLTTNGTKNAIIIEQIVDSGDSQVVKSATGVDQSLSVEMEKGKEYKFRIKFVDKYKIGNFDLKCIFVPQSLDIGENQLELKYNDNYFQFKLLKNAYYSFDLDNLVCNFKLFDKDFNLIEDGLNKEKLFVLNLNEPYYVLIDKTSCKEVTNVNFTIKDEIHITLENIDLVPGLDGIYKHSVVGNTKLPVLCIPGYNFEGWWTSSDRFGEQITDENINDIINQREFTLYAKWTVIEYNVEYIVNGGSEIENGKYIIEHIYELRQDTFKEGYLLYGWYDNPDFNGEKIERIEKGNTGNRTFYAKWIQEKFNVNLNVDSDTTDKIQATISATQYKVTYNQHFVLPVPEIKGFVFEGWVDVNNGKNKYTNAKGESLHIYLQETDIELIAKWKREEYYIGFDNNGQISWLTQLGDIFDISEEKESIQYNINLCPNCNVLTYLTSKPLYPQQIDKNFFQEGHIFTNMLTNKNDQSSIACWHNTTSDLEDGQTIVLYAGHRKETNFKVYLLVENEQSDEQVYKKIFTGNYGDELFFNLSDFREKPGYKLGSLRIHNNLDDRYNGKYVGTHLAPNKDFYIFNSSKQTMPDLSIGLQLDGEDIFLEAVYVPLEFVVSLYVDNNIEYSKVVVFGTPYNTSIGNAFPIPQKLGFDFKGWWTGINGAGSLIADENGSLVNNIWNIPNNYALYAKFEYTKYSITFVLGGGEALNNPPKYYTMKNAQELPTTSKYGYVFEGWQNANDVMHIIPEGSSGDLVLTAKWKGVLTNITGAGTYTIRDEVAIVDFSKAGITSKVLINILSSVKQVSFIGNTAKMQFKTIDVASRTDELIMKLRNVNIVGQDNRAAIHALNCKKLILESVGKNYLESGTISSNITNGAALTCRDIVIKGDELYVTGASTKYCIGKDGANGDAGILGGNDHQECTMIIYIKKLECKGGNGADGSIGEKGVDQTQCPQKAKKGKVGEKGYTGGKGGDGGLGGMGGYGILFNGEINIAKGSSLIGIGGNGGNGGNGGTGGKGGTGGEGGDAIFLGPSGKNGGQGGTGGQGGFYGVGGKMGFGLSYTRMLNQGSCTDTFGQDGYSGEVGAGGEGGKGGEGGFYLGGKERHDNGPKGEKGPSGGTIIFN